MKDLLRGGFVVSQDPTSESRAIRERNTSKGMGAALAVSLLFLGSCGTATNVDDIAPNTQPAAPKTLEASPIVGVGDPKYPSNNLGDWVTYADYVVLVKVASETPGEPQYESDSKTEYVLPRVVELSVTDTVWSQSAPPVELPGSIEYPALGDHVSLAEDGSVTTAKFVASGFSRLEPGHEYLMPLYWDEECVRVGPAWSSLGAVPFDSGVAGVGEFEGRERTQEEATRRPDNATSRDLPLFALGGLSSDQVKERLATAVPDPKPFVPTC